MSKIDDAKKFLEFVGMPKPQQADVCCLTLLALAGIGEYDAWMNASNAWVRIHDIIQFSRQQYGVDYAENTRETIRKQALHHFRRAALAEDNGKATNSPNYRYRLTSEARTLLQCFGSNGWQRKLDAFLAVHETLVNIYTSKKQMQKLPVKINQGEFSFSTGKHNALQKAVLEEFAPRFAPAAQCLYVGDTTKKDMIKDVLKLHELGFAITLHDKMPDIVLYRQETNWLYFIEAVTSVGPMSPKRLDEIKAMTQNVTAAKIYVTAFLDFKTYKKFAEQLAWETEVWVAEFPDHMIHLNGDRFMEPR
jgi:hypothetical protein